MGNRILVVPGTSTVGRALVNELAGAGAAVAAATRDPARWSGPTGARPVRFDYRDARSWPAALDGADRVFVLVPSGEMAHHELAGPFVAAAAAQGVKRIVLMTASGVEHNEEYPPRRLERLVERSGVAFVILRPTWFMDNFHSYWRDEIRERGELSIPSGEGRAALIDARDIAAAAAAALRAPDGRFDGRAFTLTGPEAFTIGEAAAMLAAAAERPIRHAPHVERFMATMIDHGIPQAYAGMLVGSCAALAAGQSTPPTRAVAELTGRPPRTLVAYAREHAAAWR